MAKNWMAYEACEALVKGTDKEQVAEIGSRFPLFAVTVMKAGTGVEALLEILKAVPKTTARVIETGLKDGVEEAEPVVEDNEGKEPVKSAKAGKKEKAVKAESDEEDDEDEELDYDSMTSKDLYALCCERGISSKCENRKKATLIDLLKKFDAGAFEENAEAEDDEEDWDEEPEEKDPYAGKSAKELFKMCKDRKINAKPKQDAKKYADLLKKDDAKKVAEPEADEDEDDDDDDWEI